jgi:hypothetical protein
MHCSASCNMQRLACGFSFRIRATHCTFRTSLVCHPPPIGPHAGYFTCAGCVDGRFQVFEALTWRSQTWSHRNSGFLVEAAWSAAASPAALILVCSRQFFSLHFTEAAPALHAQFVPLHAPQVFDAEVSSGSSVPRFESPQGVRTSYRPPPTGSDRDLVGVRAM